MVTGFKECRCRSRRPLFSSGYRDCRAAPGVQPHFTVIVLMNCAYCNVRNILSRGDVACAADCSVHWLSVQKFHHWEPSGANGYR